MLSAKINLMESFKLETKLGAFFDDAANLDRNGAERKLCGDEHT